MTASAQGEDRSDFQFVYPWTGFSFGFAKATEGTGWTGQTFPGNWANLKKAKLPRGAYHYLHPGESAVAQAQHFYNTVKAQGIVPGDMFVADVEVFDGQTGAEVDVCCKAFYDELVKLGVDPKRNPIITYTNHEVGQFLHKTAAAYPLLWFAWPSSTAPDASLIAPFKAWKFWQWGIVGGVDRDAFHGTVTDLKNWLAPYVSPVYVIVPIVTGGKDSLRQIARAHSNSVFWILFRTLAKGIQGKLLRYISGGDYNAPMPSGITLLIKEVKQP